MVESPSENLMNKVVTDKSKPVKERKSKFFGNKFKKFSFFRVRSVVKN
jgi:hypothetical protein